MKAAIAMALLGILVSSCDVSDEKLADTKDLQPPTNRNYSTAELNIGRRVCSALKFKREKMGTLDNNTAKFNFSIMNSNCTNINYGQQRFDVLIETVGTAPKYSPMTTPSVKYFSDVISDESPVFDALCSNLNSSSNVSNVILVDSSYYTVNLLVIDGYESVELKKQTKNSANQYPIVSNESISFLTSINNPGTNYLGIEKARTLSTVCAKGSLNAFSEVKQTWNSATTY